jgi:hypothetical protein
VNEVAHTARRAGASIGERLHDRMRVAGNLVDQIQSGRLGEDLLS